MGYRRCLHRDIWRNDTLAYVSVTINSLREKKKLHSASLGFFNAKLRESVNLCLRNDL